MRRRGSPLQSAWELASTLPGFDPRMVPEVAAGRFWLASAATGLGTAGFTVPEGNGNSGWNLLQATVASQPTSITSNGQSALRMRRAADANPSIIAPATTLQAGWTGNTYVAGWFRLPDASGDVSASSSNLFVHTPTTAGQRRLSLSMVVSSGDKFSCVTSNDGTAIATNQWLSTFAGDWVWVSLAVIPGTSVELSADLTQLAHTATASPGSPLFDGNAPVSIGCRAAAGLANVDTTDWLAVYYCNGIPSLFNQQRLMAFQAPKAVSFV